MKLFRIYQRVHQGYDTYDSAIVCAEDEDEARKIHPADYKTVEIIDGEFQEDYGTRCKKVSDVQVEYIGEAKEGLEKGVILPSFNAG